ncbi:MAG: hypothetical protein IEMM0002_1398 [bacterium]|nr:MAG: hypothetical protein IEMM0002_1398 [bacterium]
MAILRNDLNGKRKRGDYEQVKNTGFGNEMNVVLGGGFAGLAAGYVLAKAQKKVAVVEKDPVFGGLSRTIKHDGFKFDLGGHRFLTKDIKIENFVKDLMSDGYLVVPRTSQIYMRGSFFDYPLTPTNALFGMGIPTTAHILYDYFKEIIGSKINPREIISLEDWVVSKFGRKMFDLYFKQYSEKVWGIDCKEISAEWVANRIKGLSMWEAIKNALVKFSGKEITTLADQFLYPNNGIGVISDAMSSRIAAAGGNSLMTGTNVTRINCEKFRIKSVDVENGQDRDSLHGGNFLSSIPLPELVKLMNPAPPADIVAAADQLSYRDLTVVTVMLDCDRATDLTWMYLPEKDIAVGRIHEPKNWSPHMAPEGKTSIVAEYFCFKGDNVWNSSGEELTGTTVGCLKKLGFVKDSEVLGTCIVRVPKAYPLFSVGFREPLNKIMNYLKNFDNLKVIGRTGTFDYLNMDLAIKSGIDAAEEVLDVNSGKFAGAGASGEINT